MCLESTGLHELRLILYKIYIAIPLEAFGYPVTWTSTKQIVK